jgi:hypothetical protein
VAYTFDDYIAIKLKNTETNTKGHEKAEGITKRKLSLEEITNYNSRIYQLYMNVTKNAPFNTFYLDNHFKTFKTVLKTNFFFLRLLYWRRTGWIQHTDKNGKILTPTS